MSHQKEWWHCHQKLWQIWWLTKCVTNIVTRLITKYGESPNWSPNLSQNLSPNTLGLLYASIQYQFGGEGGEILGSLGEGRVCMLAALNIFHRCCRSPPQSRQKVIFLLLHLHQVGLLSGGETGGWFLLGWAPSVPLAACGDPSPLEDSYFWPAYCFKCGLISIFLSLCAELC